MATRSIRLPMAVRRRFYIGVSLLVALIALVGFWPTYFGPLFTGTLQTVPVIHFHAAVYSGWVGLFIAQAAFASTGRLALHRQLGKVAIGYGVGIIAVGVVTAFSRFADRVEAGNLEVAQRALLPPLTDMVVFPIFFGAALLYRRKPEIHKRLMVVATTTLLIAASARMTFLGDPVPRPAMLLVWLSPILLAMGYDLFSRRLIHPAYVLGLIGLYILSLRGRLVDTDSWLGLSGWFASFVR